MTQALTDGDGRVRDLLERPMVAGDYRLEFDVAHEADVVSAHRMPQEMLDYGAGAAERGLRVIIAGAGGAAHLPGMLAAGKTAMDALRATFPAGTMTGAPKVRAMEIIDELEPERRGPYAGAVGYIASGAKRMDLAITIRTCVIAGGIASVQTGAGIVHDSVPQMEWRETENKARAVLTAIGKARKASP